MDSETRRRLALALAVGLIVGAIVVIEQPWKPRSRVPPPPSDLPEHLKEFPAAPDFAGATGWLQTPNDTRLDLIELRGKVVLVDFWTYSCINCIRTFPHLRAWWDAYKEHGLVIVGVHSPEFRFERDPANVAEAAHRHNLTHPMALDNEFRVWDAYGNRYWPAEYLIDGYGRIRHTHFGEGGYEETEAKIRELLAEAGHALPDQRVEPLGISEGGESRKTPELYAATGRSAIGNPEGYQPGRTVEYAPPSSIERDRIYLAGSWANEAEFVEAVSENASLVVRFTAGGANFVADGPAGECLPIALDRASFSLDDAGHDVTFEGGTSCIRVDRPRSYDFYAGAFEEHEVRLTVPKGFILFTFAFSSTETME